jgi:beta-N-acetylhexosaminidase
VTISLDLDPVRLAGQLLVVGFSGPRLPDAIARALAAGHLGGVILFGRNLPSADAACALTSAVATHAAPEWPPFIGIDEEGGRVTRLPLPLPRLPALRKLGEEGSQEHVRKLGTALGGLLSALGINLDFAPVLDVDTNPDNPVIGDRSFGPDPHLVARFGAELAQGLLSSGVLPCGKHFPGHGDTSLDSHLELPYVRHPESRLRAVEFLPFLAAIRADIPALMTAHVVYDALDPEVPATLSDAIGQRLLRSELGFSGVLFSDDLEMQALSARMDIAESAERAVRAGCDALLICHRADVQARAHAALSRLCVEDARFRARALEAVNRSLAWRQRFPPRPGTPAELEQARLELETLLAARIR